MSSLFNNCSSLHVHFEATTFRLSTISDSSLLLKVMQVNQGSFRKSAQKDIHNDNHHSLEHNLLLKLMTSQY